MTLDTALSDYAAYKAGEGVRDKDAALRIKKLRKDLKSSLGEHKLAKGSLAEITRADAKTSPEIIQLAVMLYVRFSLSLRNVEDLLHERCLDFS